MFQTHKMGIESQVTSHSENPTLHTRESRCQDTCWRFNGRPTSRGGHLEDIIWTSYVKIGEQLAHILTNGVSSNVFHSALCKLNRHL
jgi:hypothetical protein